MSFLNLKPTEKTALFIDGANLYKAARNLGFDIDYKRLLSIVHEEAHLVRAYYFTAMQEDRDQDYSPLRPLVDWLDYNGYTMITKLARDYTDAQGRKRFKGSTDVELSVEMLQLADALDHVVLFSGNGDFRRLIEAVQAKGVRVTVVSTIKSSPPMASDELRRQADQFIDITNIEKTIGRAGGHQGQQNRKPRPVQADDGLDDYDYDDDDYEETFEDD
ncbi:MAG: NYN domain-containing protein [Pseudomonadota bacterium]